MECINIFVNWFYNFCLAIYLHMKFKVSTLIMLQTILKLIFLSKGSNSTDGQQTLLSALHLSVNYLPIYWSFNIRRDHGVNYALDNIYTKKNFQREIDQGEGLRFSSLPSINIWSFKTIPCRGMEIQSGKKCRRLSDRQMDEDDLQIPTLLFLLGDNRKIHALISKN